MSDWVGIPEDRFSHVGAHIIGEFLNAHVRTATGYRKLTVSVLARVLNSQGNEFVNTCICVINIVTKNSKLAVVKLYELHHEKTGYLPMQKQRHRSALQ